MPSYSWPCDQAQRRLAWGSYFLLGAGFLAPWNTFLTAIDYFSVIFPGQHVDRLFTLAYLPACLALLVVTTVVGASKWLPGPNTRILFCYSAFSIIMVCVPVADAFGAFWQPSLKEAPPGALTGLLIAVVTLGALDGACQGAVFVHAAAHAPRYTQAVVGGTSCSGLLVCFIRLACKAAWLAEPDTDPTVLGPSTALRGSTFLYFGAAAFLTGSCTVAFMAVQHMPALKALRFPMMNVTPEIDSCDGSDCGSPNKMHTPHRATGLELIPSPSQEREGLYASARSSAMGTSIWATSLAESGSGLAQSEEDGEEERGGRVTPDFMLDSSNRPLLGGTTSDRGEAFPPATPSHLQAPCGDQAVRSYAGAPHGGHHDCSLQAHRWQLLHLCWLQLWPLCAALFLVYLVTLSIFPGFLAEDLHSDSMGDWYPILVITLFNAADLAGKLLAPIGPSHNSAPSAGRSQLDVSSSHSSRHSRNLEPSPHGHSREESLYPGESGRPVTTWQWLRGPLVWPLVLAGIRGGMLLPAFGVAATHGAPPWTIFVLTATLGGTNGWLTAVAMSQGPGLLPPHLLALGAAELGEGLLVCCMVTGLLAGAVAGWLWLLLPPT